MGGLGMPEIVIIMVIALIVFGPRKLPELGKSLGKAMNQFRRASEDFKRTWEQEVDLESTRKSISTSAESSTSNDSTNYDSGYHSGEHSYDSYNSDYGYNAPSDAEVAVAHSEQAGEIAATETAKPAVEVAKPSAGQWI